MQLPSLKGGRRSKQSTFASFLATGAHTDEWLFELAAPHERPIDFIAALELDLPDGGECVWLTLAQYAAQLGVAIAQEGSDASRKALEDDLPAGPPGRRTGGMRDR